MPRLASPRLRAGATQTAASSHSSLQDVATNKSKARKYYKNVKNLRQICDTNYNLCKKLSKSSKNIQVFQKIHHVPHTEIRKRFITATNKTNSVRRWIQRKVCFFYFLSNIWKWGGTFHELWKKKSFNKRGKHSNWNTNWEKFIYIWKLHGKYMFRRGTQQWKYCFCCKQRWLLSYPDSKKPAALQFWSLLLKILTRRWKCFLGWA